MTKAMKKGCEKGPYRTCNEACKRETSCRKLSSILFQITQKIVKSNNRNWTIKSLHLYPTAASDCYALNTDFDGNDINADEDDVNFARGAGKRASSQECQELCSSTSGCEFFTYHPNVKSCYLKTSDEGKYTIHGHVSGPKYCRK